MNFKLVTEQPAWWIIFCLFAGLLYAWMMYRRGTSLDSFSPWYRRLLFLFRALVVTILAFLLLNPLIKSVTRETEKPILLIAQDNSQSILLNKDSSFYKGAYLGDLHKLEENLKDKYDVHFIRWGDRVDENPAVDYSEKQTDFSTLYKDAVVRLGNRNAGALVIASDGLYNRGSNPLYEYQGLHVPVYTIALGDTMSRKDLIVSKVNFNKTVYLGNSFPVEITVNARQCQGESSQLTVSRDTTVLVSKRISFSGNSVSQVIPVVMEAQQKGTIHLKIKLTPLPGEITQENNEKDVFIQVLDNRQKIYFVVNAPHPDAGAFRQSLEAGDNYQVKVVRASKAVDFNRSYDLLVLHNLPSDEFGVADLLKKATEFGTPVLYILGTQTSLNSFNALHSGLEITSGIRKYNSVQARVNPDFSLFQLDDATQQTIPAFPPLLAPFGKYTSTTNNYFLLTQKIGNVSSGDPLLLFNENGPVKTAVLCGEGIWRWRLSDFETTGNFNAINELLFKTVQNLCIKENRSKFRIIAKTSFNENEPVTLNAELYNDNFEPVNSPDVNIVLTDMGGKSFPYIFSKTEKAYNLNAGFFSPGNYKYKATAKLGEKVYAAEGEFTVVPLQAEQTESVADYHLLFSLAEKSGGNMYFPSQLDKLSRDLQQREDIRTVSYSRSKLQDLINLKWVFGLIMILLAAEWFLRKRAGSY